MKESSKLDVLRSLAVALVLLSHAPDFMDGLSFEFNFKAMGRLGVALFFVHTTLVLLMSLDRHGPAFGPFMIRRVFRIYPLAVAAVLSMCALLWIGGAPLSAGEIVSNALLIQNMTGHRSWPQPLWTLPYELQMYLILPALYVFTRAGKSPLRVALVYLVAVSFATLMWSQSVHLLLIGFAPCFLPGAIAFVLLRAVRAVLSSWVLFGLVLIGAALMSQFPGNAMQEIPVFWVVCLVIGVTIPLCREIEYPPLVASAHCVAKYSYGVYVTHVFVMGMALMGSSPWYVRAMMFAVLQASVAFVAFRFIEEPGIRVANALAERMSARRAALIA